MANIQRVDEELRARYVSLPDLMKYTGLGRPSAEKIADVSGARCKIGTGRTGRVIYDLEKIDKYIADHS